MIEYRLNGASEAENAEHLLCCDAHFFPRLSGRVEIRDYAKKITAAATRFEAWSDGILIGLLAVYCNDRETSVAFITSVSVLNEWSRRGIATSLLKSCVEHIRTLGMRKISLQVACDNVSAIMLYRKNGFAVDHSSAQSARMSLELETGVSDAVQP